MSVTDEIKSKLDIVEIVSEYVNLRKSGRNYTGFCPFHTNVRTPSFVVFSDTQTWHCFGACGTGGDVFSFVMKRENMDFPEALRFLAQRAGVELKPRTPAQATEDERQERLREINAAAAHYFHNLLLNTAAGAKAREYLAGRALHAETIKSFQLGYALDEWQALKDYLTGQGYSADDILAAGLIAEREGGGHYDRFRGRLMIPIRDVRGRVIGFGARTMGDAMPKYLNSPQTPLFDKSRVLFGMDRAKGAIRAQGLAVIVEGYMDVMQAHQAGFQNVVAEMGTALTEAQLRLLKRYTKRVVLALDPDTAGSEATLRGLAVARRTLDRQVVPVFDWRGLIRYEERLDADLRIGMLPAGKDPDDLIRESPAQWAELVQNASPIVEYYLRTVVAGLDLTTAKGKAQAVEELKPIIREIGDSVQRAHYLQSLARLIHVDERTLLREFERERKGRRPERGVGERTAPPIRPSREASPTLEFGPEEYCLVTLLLRPDLLAHADDLFRDIGLEALGSEDFGQIENRRVFASLREHLDAGETFDLDRFVAEVDEVLQPRLRQMLEWAQAAPPVPEERLREDVLNSIIRLRERTLKRESEELHFLLGDAEEQGDAEAVRRYEQIKDTYRKTLNQIYRALADRTLFSYRVSEGVSGSSVARVN